jgi:hypothetical protein
MAGGISGLALAQPCFNCGQLWHVGNRRGKSRNRGGRNGKPGGTLRNRRGTTRVQITDFSTKLIHRLLNRIYKDFLRPYLWITSADEPHSRWAKPQSYKE